MTPFRAAEIAETFMAEWSHLCPNSPLLAHKSAEPFRHAIAVARAEAIDETRTYTFADGSILVCRTDRNGQHSLQASLTINR